MSGVCSVSKEDILLSLSSTNKFDSFNEILTHLVNVGKVGESYRESLHKILVDREEQASFAMGRHVAIPHINGVENLEECLFVYGRSLEGIEFGSCDTGLVNHIFLVLIPEQYKCGWLKTLSKLARYLSLDSTREFLQNVSDEDEALVELNEILCLE